MMSRAKERKYQEEGIHMERLVPRKQKYGTQKATFDERNSFYYIQKRRIKKKGCLQKVVLTTFWDGLKK